MLTATFILNNEFSEKRVFGFRPSKTLQKCLEKLIEALEPVLIVDCIRELFKAP